MDVMPESRKPKIAVLTRRWSWFGTYVLQLLAQRRVTPNLILVENTTMRARLAMARRLARRIGWVDAIRYNLGFWLPGFRRLIGMERSAKFDYEQFSDCVIEASDINATEMVAGLIDHGIERILLAHCGIIRKPILDVDGIWIINSHPGYLPRMRGVDVIRWSILEDVTPAISTHIVDSGIDTGPVIDRETVIPLPNETLANFERRIGEFAARKLVECALAGPGTLPAPEPQYLRDGQQYYLMPLKWLPKVEERFSAMKRRYANHEDD